MARRAPGLLSYSESMAKLSRLFETIAREQKRYYFNELKGEGRLKRMFYASMCFFSILWSEVKSFKLFIRASSGTYTTMLALVPFMIVGASLILTFNKEVNLTALVAQINEYVLPVAGDTIATFLSESLARTLDLGLGPVGVISLLVTSVMLFVHVEDCINDIWHVTRPRAFYLRILLFYAIITLGPILISFSIFQATQIFSDEFMSGVVGATVWKIVRETLLTSIACFVVFKFLPNTRVPLKCAAIPAVVVSIILEVFKLGFSFYLSVAFTNSSNYSILYGALGMIPLTLLWVYITWVVMLLGVQASYCMQNMRILLLNKFYDVENEASWVFLGAYAPIEVLAALVRRLCAGAEPPTVEQLSVECTYPAAAIEAVMSRLERLGVVRMIENEFAKTYILARPLDAIVLHDVMAGFDESSPRAHKFPKVGELVTQLITAQDQILGNSNANVLREDGVVLKDIGNDPTKNLHVDEG